MTGRGFARLTKTQGQSQVPRLRCGKAAGIRFAGLVAAVAVPAALALFFVSCSKDAPSPLLNPPGTPHLSKFQTIQLTGSFKSWSLDVSGMSLVADYVWEERVSLTAGDIGFKFLVDGNGWSDVFGLRNAEKTLEGPVERMGDVYGADLKATIPYSGDWVFRLYEDRLRYSITPAVSITGAIKGKLTFSHKSTPPFPAATLTAFKVAVQDTQTAGIGLSDTLTGDFLLSGLSDGNYFVKMQAAGYRDSTVDSITVSAGGTTDIGTIQLAKVAFVGRWTTLQLAGSFPQSNWNLATSPRMSLTDDNVWSVTVSLSAGSVSFKFVPDGNWDPAYGRVTVNQGALTDSTNLARGVGTHLAVTVPSSGNWKFTLHERGYLGNPNQAWYEIAQAVVRTGGTGRPSGARAAAVRRRVETEGDMERGNVK